MDVLQLEACEVDLGRRVVRRDGASVALTEQEAGLLAYLAERAGRPVGREELLREVWGFAGRSLVTRAVDVAVSRLRQKLERDPGQPVHVLTQRGVGYRFEGLGHEPLGDEVPTGHDALQGRTSLVGRADDLAVLEERLAEGARLVSVVGPAGVGKTRLAAEVGRRRLERGALVTFVELIDARTTTDLLRCVAAALGAPVAPETEQEARVEQLGRALDQRGPLVAILDNLEHLYASHGVLEAWLRAAPGLQVVVTSRARLRLDGEVCLKLGSLPDDEALALFLERARSVQRGYAAGDEGTVLQIVRELEGMPLAIELAAARAGVLSPSMLLEGLAHRFQLLATPTPEGRQETLYRALQWSWGLLDAVEQQALAQCSVFRGGFSLRAAAEVVVLGPGAPLAVDWLQALVDRSLVRVAALPAGPSRYHLLESQRQFAHAQLAERELAEVEARHGAFYLALGTRLAAGLRRREGERCLAELSLERDNLRAVAEGAESAEHRVQATLALDGLLEVHGPVEERLASLTAALELGPTPALAAPVHISRAQAHLVRAEGVAAGADARRALELARGLDDAALVGRALEVQAAVHALGADYEAAHAAATEALAAARGAGDLFGEGQAHHQLGAVAARRGEREEAVRHYRRMRAAANELGASRMQIQARCNLGYIARTAGRVDDAHEEYTRALQLARAIGDRAREAMVLGNLGAIASVRGKQEAAVERFRASLALHRVAGSRQLETMALGNYGLALLVSGRHREARSTLAEALELTERTDDPRRRGVLEGNLGLCQVQLGELRDARYHLGRAVELLRSCAAEFATAYFSAHLAIVAADLDDLQAAVPAGSEAEGIAEGGHPVARGLVQVVRAHLALARERAARREGAAVAALVAEVDALCGDAEAWHGVPPSEWLGSGFNSVLPSELDAALAHLRAQIEAARRG